MRTLIGSALPVDVPLEFSGAAMSRPQTAESLWRPSDRPFRGYHRHLERLS
jgi:hypothetical protein